MPIGRLSSWVWPSGDVCGIPSTIILMPLIPKEDLAPNPLIDNLRSWEKLFADVVKTPGILFRYSCSDNC